MPKSDRSEMWILVGILVGGLLVAGLLLVIGSYVIDARTGWLALPGTSGPELQQGDAPR
jgi:hypothetical protein